MRKVALLVGSCTALAVVATAAAATPAAPAGKPALVLHYLDINTNFAANWPQNRAPEFGDQGLFQDKIYTWQGANRGRLVGHLNGTIIFLNAQLTRISVVATIPGGTIDVFGDSGEARATTYSVLGGTGRYANMRGEAIVRTLGSPDSNNDSVTIKLWR
jgi:Dirigent-like protein